MRNKENKSQCSQNSSCIPQETEIKNVRLAAAYVPFQILCDLFTPLQALNKGTAFPELYSPYETKEKREPERRRVSYEK
ncbi:spore coat associated protein CotJA [Clostridium gasigenes]|uniref:spore coat associated protein CotJA n=1 Tax=Clostridium gasigenes TaxID=94869 RepID=UPI0014384951|nr:spore coat associated protein CotJA [Clostridium gasigenes]MBB6625597.1 spore coat associated protein CotJA [Clostridium gasigenes]MBU3090301.1 spore coat associated protein CotJA [Clostridium gasigenes]MBU3133131.1 spore coat associated protein CotJA [Clostridium gasigenes]NKF08754.1 spore coat associated protein CotJA [Clostridium gasigenes]QSW21360.1 spore coat associated protein CotJA [Clostridium gasigenes]